MTQLIKYICETCGTQHAAAEQAPAVCHVCGDERQYVGWQGQTWTTHDELLRTHRQRMQEEGGLLGFGMTPGFAIDQRAFLLPTDAGNILWETVPIVTPEAVRAIEERGGVDRIAISHPHFYASMGEWSDALGGAPILLHEADREWIQRPHPSIELWAGDELELSDSVTLIRTGGHFAGSTALHWANGPRPGGALFSGDVPQVVMDQRHVSFMYSYPNLIPMRTRHVLALRERLSAYEFEDVFGYTWGRVVRGGGRAAVDESFERYLAAVMDVEEGLEAHQSSTKAFGLALTALLVGCHPVSAAHDAGEDRSNGAQVDDARPGDGAEQVGKSPWGPSDEIGRLNLMTDDTRAAVLSRIGGGRVYDLSVDYFVGMPSWQAAGDPHYRMWMTHTPHGTVIDDPLGLGRSMNEHVSYTGTAVSMYTHMGTHIDALSHFGLVGRIWNGFAASERLGDRGWAVAGAEKLPPIVARGVMLDVAAAKGVDMLAPGYRVTDGDLRLTVEHQQTVIETGDVVLIRTGRMRLYENPEAYMDNPPGLSLSAARYLVEERGAMVVGADNLSFEAFPSEIDGNYVPLHTYLLAEQGTPILEVVDLESLARDRVHVFAFIAGSLKLKGADAAPLRPLAIPLNEAM